VKALLLLLVPAMGIGCSQSADLVYPDDSFTAGISVPARPELGRYAFVCGSDQGSVTSEDSPSVIDGTWSGQFENYVFSSGSSRVDITLAHQSSGAVLGKVTLGNQPRCAPTQCPPDDQNPELGCPRGILFAVDAKDPPPPSPPYDGFTYTALDGSFDGSELSVGIDPREFWIDWCEQQNTVFETKLGFACAVDMPTSDRSWEGNGEALCTFGRLHESCNKLALCVRQTTFAPVVSGVCDCTTLGCSVCLLPNSAPITFQFELAGDTLSGTVQAVDTPSMARLAETIGGKKLTLNRVSP
jgi:hypothetical protein